MAKLARLLNLTAALLNTRVPMTAEEIRARVRGYPESDLAFHRSFERDKDDLRELGVPVDTVTVTHHESPKAAYTIDEKRYSLPDPDLSREELAALQLARTAVMFEGIAADEVEDTFRKLGGVGRSGEGSTPLGSIPLSENLAGIFEAINQKRTLQLDYADSERVLEPLSLRFNRGRWYLSAFDRGRDGIRNFRVDRIAGRVTSGPPDSFPARDTDSALVTSPWATGDGKPVQALVLLDKEPAQATLLEYPDLKVVEQREDASVMVELQVLNVDGLFSFLAGLLDRAEVIAPPDLREAYVMWLKQRAGL